MITIKLNTKKKRQSMKTLLRSKQTALMPMGPNLQERVSQKAQKRITALVTSKCSILSAVLEVLDLILQVQRLRQVTSSKHASLRIKKIQDHEDWVNYIAFGTAPRTNLESS